MKKIICVLSVLLVLTCAVFAMAACSEKDAVITSYSIEKTTYKVGDAFSTDDVVITAELANGDKIKVDKNLYFDQSAITTEGDDAVLKDGEFAKAGDYQVKVYAVEERDDLLIGTWNITVE